MSEKELVILQNIKYAIDNYNKFEFGDFQYDDIKRLVDLYIKEKEKNKELENAENAEYFKNLGKICARIYLDFVEGFNSEINKEDK